jgi:hypothetical protein
MSPHRSGLVQASLPVVFGFVGFLKLGGFHLGLLVLVAVLAAFAYRSGHHRAKYGTAPTKSLLFGEIPGKPPLR